MVRSLRDFPVPAFIPTHPEAWAKRGDASSKKVAALLHALPFPLLRFPVSFRLCLLGSTVLVAAPGPWNVSASTG